MVFGHHQDSISATQHCVGKRDLRDFSTEVIARSHTESQTKLFRDPDGLRLTGVFRGAVSQEFIKPGWHVMKHTLRRVR